DRPRRPAPPRRRRPDPPGDPAPARRGRGGVRLRLHGLLRCRPADGEPPPESAPGGWLGPERAAGQQHLLLAPPRGGRPLRRDRGRALAVHARAGWPRAAGGAAGELIPGAPPGTRPGVAFAASLPDQPRSGRVRGTSPRRR